MPGSWAVSSSDSFQAIAATWEGAGSDPSSFMLADSSWRSSPNETMRSQPGRLMAENSATRT